MLQGLLAKKAIELVIKKIMEKKEIRNLKKYVEQDNDLDLQVRAHAKSLDKYGRYIEELDKDVAILKKDSHAPIFGKNDYKDIIKRLNKLEKRRK